MGYESERGPSSAFQPACGIVHSVITRQLSISMRTIKRGKFVADLHCVAVLDVACSSARAATPGKLDARDVNLSSVNLSQ
jgi:hypothetical protein